MLRPLDLDFSACRTRRRRLAGAAALALTCSLAALALQQQGALEARIAELEAAAAAIDVRSPRILQPSEAELRALKTAQDAQRALNQPWESLLGALEQAQDGKVNLLALQPSPLKGEVVLSGEAVGFDALMGYLKALRAQPVFADVVLLNQRQVDQDGQRGLAFTLAAEWRTGAP